MKKTISYITPFLLLTSTFAEEDPFSMSLEELLDVKVESASKYSENILAAPSSVTVFTADDISRMGLRTLDELLGYVPGFVVSNLSDRIALTVRGSRSYSSVLLLVDGQRVNEPLFHGFGITNPEFSLENIKKIEVIRGPGSALYGTGAYLGVINVTTKFEENYVMAELGENSMKSFSGSFYKKFEKLEMSIHSEAYRDENYTYKQYPESVSSGNGSTITNYINDNGVDSKDRFDLQMKLKYKKFKLHYNHQKRRYLGGTSADGIKNSAYYNRSEPSRTNILASYQFDFSEGHRLNAKLGYLQNKFNPFGLRGTRDNYDYFSGGLNITNQYQVGLEYFYTIYNTQIAAGFEYLNEGLTTDSARSNFDSDGNHQNEIVDLGEIYPSPRIKSYGTYIQLQKDITDNHKVTAGLRFDENSAFGSALTPRVALISQYKTKTSTKFMYGEAFRSPSLGDAFQDSVVVKGNENLRPEKVKTFEASVAQDFWQSRASLTYYLSQFDKTIFAESDGSFIRTYNSVHPDKREGLEFEFSTKLPWYLTFKTNYSYVFKIKQTESLVPDHFVTGSYILNWAYKKFNFNLNGLYKRSYVGLDQSSLFIVNTKLEYRPNKEISYFVRGSNLGNKEYLNTTFVRTNHQVNRGRILAGGVEMRF